MSHKKKKIKSLIHVHIGGKVETMGLLIVDPDIDTEMNNLLSISHHWDITEHFI